MALSGFNHNVGWHEFREVRQRPRGAREDARIRAEYPYTYRVQRQRDGGCRVASVRMRLGVVRSRSWAVRGRKTAALLRHEQGHYNITALGARELYNQLTALTVARCRNLRGAARRLERQIQARVDRANRRYDTQTAHGTNATVQQTWETSIRAAKQRANGTIANLP